MTTYYNAKQLSKLKEMFDALRGLAVEVEVNGVKTPKPLTTDLFDSAKSRPQVNDDDKAYVSGLEKLANPGNSFEDLSGHEDAMSALIKVCQDCPDFRTQKPALAVEADTLAGLVEARAPEGPDLWTRGGAAIDRANGDVVEAAAQATKNLPVIGKLGSKAVSGFGGAARDIAPILGGAFKTTGEALQHIAPEDLKDVPPYAVVAGGVGLLAGITSYWNNTKFLDEAKGYTKWALGAGLALALLAPRADNSNGHPVASNFQDLDGAVATRMANHAPAAEVRSANI
jgi:hypothetical protein